MDLQMVEEIGSGFVPQSCASDCRVHYFAPGSRNLGRWFDPGRVRLWN